MKKRLTKIQADIKKLYNKDFILIEDKTIL